MRMHEPDPNTNSAFLLVFADHQALRLQVKGLHALSVTLLVENRIAIRPAAIDHTRQSSS